MSTDPEKLYDLKELRLIAPDDEAFVGEMVRMFISGTEELAPEIRDYLATGDMAKIKAAVHKIKPSVMVMGAVKVHEIILNIELLEISSHNLALFSDLCSKLELALEEVNSQLRCF
ncbi:MAG: Hpt domain-containing protein [Bacteroidales bacterium]